MPGKENWPARCRKPRAAGLGFKGCIREFAESASEKNACRGVKDFSVGMSGRM